LLIVYMIMVSTTREVSLKVQHTACF